MKLCAKHRVHELSWKTGPETSTNEAALSFAEPPANLREWFSDSTISFWILQEVQRLYWADLHVSARHASAEIRGVLSVLAFGFVGLIFSSNEIAQACRSDAKFQQLGGGSAFFPHELWNARRRYRGELEQVLAGVFSQAIRSRFGLASSVLPQELQEDLRRHAAERLDIARQWDACGT